MGDKETEIRKSTTSLDIFRSSQGLIKRALSDINSFDSAESKSLVTRKVDVDKKVMGIGDLSVGSKVVDNSWTWEYRIGPEYWRGEPYSGSGETKPVTWVVVAKNHYSGGETGSVEGEVSHVTLITEKIIGRYIFDNSTNRGDSFGISHWGDSGSTDATHGIRKFLNGSSYTGADSNSYSHTLYDTVCLSFKKGILTTILPNNVGNTRVFYETKDKIFLPSTTELGDNKHGRINKIGVDWGYFTDKESRTTSIVGDNSWYWTRSPRSDRANYVFSVRSDGSFGYYFAYRAYGDLRPAINMFSEIQVSGSPNSDGVYEIIHSEDVD